MAFHLMLGSMKYYSTTLLKDLFIRFSIRLNLTIVQKIFKQDNCSVLITYLGILAVYLSV